MIREGEGGIFYPQNEVYVCTEDLMRKIAEYHRHRILFFPGLGGFLVKAAGRTGKKVFGSLAYDIEKDRYKLKGNVDQIIAASEITEGMKNAGQIADAHKPYGEKNEKTDFI